jgi:hypothetical protein
MYTDIASVGDGVNSSTAVMSGDATSTCLCGNVFLFAQIMLRYGLILPDGGCRCEGQSGVQLACEWEHTVSFDQKTYGSEIINKSQDCNDRSFRRLS